MPKILLIDGTNYNFNESAPIIRDTLGRQPDLSCTMTADKGVLAAPELEDFDVVMFGSGFTRRAPRPDGKVDFVPELSDAEARGLLSAVRGGTGFVGLHTTGWAIGGQYVLLVGGSANVHPPRVPDPFPVHIADPGHPITAGVDDFAVVDEIYITARDPAVHVLATADWSGWHLPMAWTHAYGEGRVFYTTLGHGPSTFENPAMQRLLVNAARWVARH